MYLLNKSLNYFIPIYKFIFKIAGMILPVNSKLIIFESFYGKQFSDNPRAIFEYIKKHYPEYTLLWSVDRSAIDKFSNKDVMIIKRFSIKWLFYMNIAKYWVFNSRMPLWIPKPKDTSYLQTWHGTPLKRLATDMYEVHMPGTNTHQYKQNFLKEAKKWDLLVSPNAYSTEIFRRAFSYEKKITESGYPRNDFLFNSNNVEEIMGIKQSINLPLNKKIILYAPTWRDNQFYEIGKYKFDLELDLYRLKEELGEDYIVLLRLHYLVAENINMNGLEEFVYDLSNHEDIRELYLIADVLITDYSSVFFDYANLNRPMLFFIYDIEEYRDNLRGFYFNFEEEAPGPLVKSTNDIVTEIKKIDHYGFQPSETTLKFYKKFCYLEDGKASERVVRELLSKPKKDTYI